MQQDPPHAAAATGAARRLTARVVNVAAKLAYPVVILFAWHSRAPRYVGCALFGLLCVQQIARRGALTATLKRISAVEWSVAALLGCGSAVIVATNSELLLRLYPGLVNLGLLIAFGTTLVRGPSMVEKFARLRKPDLSEPAVRYTRHVTQVWCAFFVLNGAFSLYTALCWPRDAWSLYNGAIAYGLIGLLFVGEIVWRYVVVLPRVARSAPPAPQEAA
ncbi:hypothetical protein QYH69_15965 [Paraburkholderia sp. SARCC-3016]|uniref:COG4648 family protein n=1 Tax=Paraburkholderia sp. SARCC-3016 TaxID=3058611 RepID=UPI002808200A|nr:hypothetical protein [Paraburkholderia sp. SARCC-3016]MDQ7978744.1 hypothetical protein [Paraburkholderia sp. SARCC-3016]